MKKNYLVIHLILLFASENFAQEKKQWDPYLDSIYNVSAIQIDEYDYKSAIETSFFLIEETEKRNNIYYRYHAHTLLGWGYGDLLDSIRSKAHYEEALVLALELKNDTLILWSYNNLGNIYSEDSTLVQKGINYYKKVINLADKLNIPSEKYTPTLNIAWTYIDIGDFQNARPYLQRAADIANKEDIYSLSELNYLWGLYYMGINELDKAEQYFKKGIELVEKNSLILESSFIYKEYANSLYKQEKYQEAFAAMEKYDEYSSTIYEKERLKQIEAANAQYDVTEYQRHLSTARNEEILKDEIIERSRERMLIMVISSFILLIILVVLLKISRSRRRLLLDMKEKNGELVKAKEEAERLSLLKTKFFSTISHELRTPLYGVIGLTTILLDDKTLAKHEEDLKSLKFSADYLLALINDVLQMNKMESNLVKLEHLPFNLDVLMRSIVKSFEFTRLQNKNNIQLAIDPNIPTSLTGDSVRLSQILMNLVGNAMKFTERGNIRISSKLVEEQDMTARILFEVKDDGMGIPLNKRSIIFEEFSQLKSVNYNYQGTGLGLPIVRKLLWLFDSEIQLESEEGIGSNFYFEIEFEKDLTALLEENSTSGKEHIIFTEVNSEGKLILIVDDNRINQVVTRKILEQKGFKCDICDNGLDAVMKVKNNRYDLILMDINMPGISGLETTEKIREFNTLVPVIALTAVEIEEIRAAIVESGMNDIIVKPYDTSTFYQVIYRNISGEIVKN